MANSALLTSALDVRPNNLTPVNHFMTATLCRITFVEAFAAGLFYSYELMPELNFSVTVA